MSDNNNPASDDVGPTGGGGEGIAAAAAAAASSLPGAADETKPATEQEKEAATANGDATADADAADWQVQRDTAKAAGDAAFKSHDFATAIEHYTTALSVDPDNAKLYSNRSAAYLKAHQKSKALHDAQKCVAIGDMGIKGISRLAAALQALGRFQAALDEWNKILKDDSNHAAATQGAQACRQAVERIKEQQQQKEGVTQESSENSKDDEEEDDVDDLDDFFNDVEEATSEVVRAKQEAAEEKATNAIKNHKKDLGTAHEQIARLLADNYKWRNLNPFYVLDIDHTANAEEISRRYKALSLLLHPDKNQSEPQAQDAYDQVLKAKATLDDEHKASHARQLIEQGLKHGKADYETHVATSMKKRKPTAAEAETLLQDFQSKAVQRIFAQVEHKRREVEKRERNQQQREQQQEEAELAKARQSRKFDKEWKQEERVDERIGNWRDFQQKKKRKT